MRLTRRRCCCFDSRGQWHDDGGMRLTSRTALCGRLVMESRCMEVDCRVAYVGFEDESLQVGFNL